MNSSSAQPTPRAGVRTDPHMRAVSDTWAEKIAQAKQSLQALLRNSLGGQRIESLLTQVGESIPAVRERSQPRVIGWIRCRKSSGVSLKLRRVGWQHLCDAIDPAENALVLTWGTTAGVADPQWNVTSCAKRELPPAAFRRGVILRLRELLVLIPQKEHLLDLNGRVLVVTAGEVSIE